MLLRRLDGLFCPTSLVFELRRALELVLRGGNGCGPFLVVFGIVYLDRGRSHDNIMLSDPEEAAHRDDIAGQLAVGDHKILDLADVVVCAIAGKVSSVIAPRATITFFICVS
jgi:hypothetical protein